jgi:hypothetical protein
MPPPAIKKFGPGDRIYVRAQQAWLILVAYVMFGGRGPWRTRLLTYGELAELMGLDPRAAIGLGRELGLVGAYCLENGLPALNCIVVGRETNAPGLGVVFRRGRTWQDDARESFSINWFQYRVPSTGTFRQIQEGT